MVVEVTIFGGLVTSKTAQWGPMDRERFEASQEAIRHAVQSSPHKAQLKEWLESGTKLALEVEFNLAGQRAELCDLDTLIADLLNPLVEGACGPRPASKSVPQTKDRLFWRVVASKVKIGKADDEKTVLRVEPFARTS